MPVKIPPPESWLLQGVFPEGNTVTDFFPEENWDVNSDSLLSPTSLVDMECDDWSPVASGLENESEESSQEKADTVQFMAKVFDDSMMQTQQRTGTSDNWRITSLSEWGPCDGDP
eukprot:2894287-Rhodomonas_salina.1